MKALNYTRRQAITTASAGAIGTLFNWSFPSLGKVTYQDKPAILGGTKLRTKPWPQWELQLTF